MLNFGKYIKRPNAIFVALLKRCNFFISDKLYLKLMYFLVMKKTLNLNNPKTFNEKIQWLKLYDRNPHYTQLVDKILVKQYVTKILGDDIIIPTLAVWDSPESIEFDKLPSQFVLKTNHSGGGCGVVVCSNKENLNICEIRKQLRSSFNNSIYSHYKEWPYKNVKRKVLAEKLLVDAESKQIRDYKFLCFNGKVKCCFVCVDRYIDSGIRINFYDLEWNKLTFQRHYPNFESNIHKPKSYLKMIEYAERLSKGIKFVRVDFYEVNAQPFFGEMTFYPGSGLEEFTPEEWDYILGSWIDL